MPDITVSSVAALRTALADPQYTTIYVTPGDYFITDTSAYNGFIVSRDVTIAVAPGSGSGVRANFYSRVGLEKAIFFVNSPVDVTFDGIGFYDSILDSTSSNVAGIRFDGQALTILNSYFKNNADGILGTAGTFSGTAGFAATLTVRNSQFVDNGRTSDDQQHAIYFDGHIVDIEGSQFVNYGAGHAIKTVAHQTRVVNTLIDGGIDNQPVNLEGGGSLIATGNTINNHQVSGNSYIFYLGEGRSNDDLAETILISGNTINNDRNGQWLLGNFNNATATVTNNTLTGPFNPDIVINGFATMSGNTLNGSAFAPELDLYASRINLTAGDDTATLNIQTGYIDAFDAMGGNDVLTSGSNSYFIAFIHGGDGNDRLTGASGNDYLYGDAGNDLLLTSTDTAGGGQWLDGGDGIDFVVARRPNGGSRLLGGAGDDILDARLSPGVTQSGGDGNDIILGSPGYDAISGGYGDDIIYGNSSLGIYPGGQGEQYFYGGPGVDTAVYAGNYGTDLTVNLQYGVIFQVLGVSAAGLDEAGGWENLTEFEYVQFNNGVYDVAAQTFNAGQVRVSLSSLLALDYNTWVPGSGGGGGGGTAIPWPTTTNTVTFTPDNMYGTSANDYMFIPVTGAITHAFGYDGDDHLVVENWNSALEGGNGTDVFEVRDFAKVAGDDEIWGWGGISAVNPNRSADYYVFNIADFAGPGWALDPAEKWAWVYGFDNGLDKIAILEGGTSRDEFSEFTLTQVGADAKISAPGMPYILLIDTNISILDASDFIFVDAPSGQTLTGTTGVDTLTGGTGDDTITGLGGDDALAGGDGADTFRYTGASESFDSVDGGLGGDTITATVANAVIGLSSLTGVETITAGGFSGVTIAGSAAANTLDFASVTLSGITAIDGGDGNDTITGSTIADTLRGGLGNDALNGGDGNDSLQGDAGTNTLDGGIGTDLAVYSGAKASYTVTQNPNGSYALTGSGVTDTLSNIENVQFSDGTFAIGSLIVTGQTITGTASAETLTGTSGNDTITGLGGDDTINAGGGDDQILQSGTGAGYDIVNGGLGNDTFRATAANTALGLTSITGVETISSGGFAGVSLRGSTVADALDFSGVTLTGITLIDGQAGNDVITGSATADTIRGSGGNDTLNGGGGDDTFQYTGTASGFDAVNGGNGADTIIALAANSVIGLSSVSGVEAITANALAGVYIAGSGAADTLDFTGVMLSGITRIDAGAGNDTVTGSAAADVIVGGTGNDVINGGDGNDTFQVSGAAPGADTYNGGLGSDTVIATAASTVITLAGASGIETFSSGGFASVSIALSGGNDSYDFTGVTLSGITRIDAGAGADTVTGSAAADVIVGGTGNDVLSGGDGNDTFQVTGTTHGLDIFSGGAGTDTVIATAANTVIGLLGASTIETFSSGGFAGVSILLSSGVDNYNFNGNTLTGITKINASTGNDTLTGSAGIDTLQGGGGQDVLTGAGGNDIFLWDDGEFGAMTETGSDRITDFATAGEKLNLTAVDANLANGTGTDEAFSYIGTAAFSNVAGQLRYQQINGNTYVMGDQTGDGAADFWIRLDGLNTLAASNFML